MCTWSVLVVKCHIKKSKLHLGARVRFCRNKAMTNLTYWQQGCCALIGASLCLGPDTAHAPGRGGTRWEVGRPTVGKCVFVSPLSKDTRTLTRVVFANGFRHPKFCLCCCKVIYMIDCVYSNIPSIRRSIYWPTAAASVSSEECLRPLLSMKRCDALWFYIPP